MMKAEVRKLMAKESSEDGWALLALILVLMVIGVLLVSAVPSVKFAVQRDKEAEMLYRGEQMAEAIGRYYNNNHLGTPQLLVPPPYGFLTELKKLKNGVTMGEREVRFARASAIIDPMTNEEWEPVRARDPRIGPFLQAFAAFTGVPIPPQLTMIAGAPPKLQTLPPAVGGQQQPGAGVANANRSGGAGIGQPPGSQPGGAGQQGRAGSTQPVLDDDDDDDDDDAADPLAHLFKDSSDQPGKSNLPIVGVAPKLKGPAVRSLYGLTNYEEWVFIYIPPQQSGQGQNPNFPQRGQDQGNRPRISQ